MLLGFALLLAWQPSFADMVIVVSAKSPLTVLSKTQLVDIFLGKSNRFPDGSRAVPIDHSEGSALRDEFYSAFAGKSPAQVKAYWAKIIFTGRGQPPQTAGDSVEARKLVAANAQAIAYIDRSAVDSSVKVIAPP